MLLEHLHGVEAILRRWGAPEHVCRAGLFHSVYGTEAFGERLFSADERSLVKGEIGADAERLVALFCTVRRASLAKAIAGGEPYVAVDRQGGPMPLTAGELRGLVTLVWANALEQEARLPSRDHAGVHARLAEMAPWLPEPAVAELRNAFSRLARLLSPALREPFLEHHWPHTPFVTHGPVDRLAELVSYDFEQLIAMRKGYTRAFGRDANGKKVERPMQPGQEREAYEAGFTIYFHGLHAPGLSTWVDALDSELGLLPGATRVSAFASKRGLGLKPHYDMNSNFVCQARGSKRWRYALRGNVRAPTLGYTIGEEVTPAHAAEVPEGFPSDLPEPFETVTLTPGSVMFMPRGVWHDTETVDEASLHFNVQTGLVTWRELMQFVTQSPLAQTPSCRGDVAPTDDMAQGVASRLRELAANLENGGAGVDMAALQHFIAGRRGNL